ncbi:MAG: GntR family transcriptional regulator [Oscillospiraceae bacterium]
MFSLDLQSRIPIYEQMKNKIIELVMLGALPTGEQLPSVRSLAKELGVNPNTVQKAYAELEREGITVTIAGKGSVIADCTGKENPIKMLAITQLKTAMCNGKSCGITKKDTEELLEDTYKEEQNND